MLKFNIISSLQKLGIGKVCLRLAHVYEVGEDKDDSVMANISKVTKMNLSGNQERIEMVKKRHAWKVKDSSQGKIAVAVFPVRRPSSSTTASQNVNTVGHALPTESGQHLGQSLYNQPGAPGAGPSPGDAHGAESTESSDKM
ncbi:hypothetical protein Tco_1336271 [Tanacetum coccineum]